MKITVQTQDDWLAIAQLEGPVVDPMILRSGEIFLRGAAGARDPLLLAHASGPADVLGLALELRKSGEVRDYRSWLLAALTDFDANGRITIERTREVEGIERAIRRRLAGLPLPSVEIKTTVAAITGGALPAPGIDLGKPMAATWGWLVSQIPGRRHRKLLTRAVIADREYVEIDRRLRTVWSGAGVPA